LKVEFGRRF